MKKLFSIFALLSLATGFVACETTEQTEDNKEYNVELTADKTAIVANGSDAATFTVKVDGKATTNDVMIICLNDNSVLEGNTFTTTTGGEYRFKASYKGFTSDTLAITATPTESPVPTVELSVDKDEIVADNTDTATFTVKVDGEDKSSEAKITVINYNSELESNSFATDVAGEFVFVANWDGVKSNEVKVVATAVETPVQKTLKIQSDVNRIKADGTEKATFTVLYGEDDVTADAEIYCSNHENVTVEGNTFSSTTVGSYSFRARYAGQTTGSAVSIDVYDPELVGKYEIGAIYEVNGVKSIIYAIKTDRHGDTYVYVMSLDEEDLQWSTEKVWCNCVSEYGHWNTEDMLRNGTSPEKYPAAQWCVSHGEGWCMPSSKELRWMWEAITNGELNFQATSVAEWNKLLTDNGGEPFCETYYWSSNETSVDLVEVIAFMNDSVVCLDPQKDQGYTVRASYRFKVE
ncbi:MAG: hypothetical protein IJN51_04530 [Alistipes sp.]|nr:hypothetical protein [Alistipes sp.]MBQ6940550.1 hypothetical protein [Alistipes sp.]